jgi:hypothetical protein
MSDTKEQVLSFLEACEELKSCKFIMATTKIKDLLKCIVNCPEIYRLFQAVTKNFNYPEAKKSCLVTVNEGVFEKNSVILPQTVGQRLAFIFCLFVEFNENTINFNDFLCRFYPEDGSYVAGYRVFCETVVKGLQDAVAQVFKDDLSAVPVDENAEQSANPRKTEVLSALKHAIAEELHFLLESKIADDEKEGGAKILSQLYAAVHSENEELIDALIFGYNYFAIYNKCVSDTLHALIEAIALFEREI